MDEQIADQRERDAQLQQPIQNYEVHRVSIKLPPFWLDKPRLWFLQAESQFTLSNIVNEITKFHHVVSQLDQRMAAEVEDVIANHPLLNPYTFLRDKIIERLSASEEQRIRQLISTEELGDRKPSQFLRHIRSLANATICCVNYGFLAFRQIFKLFSHRNRSWRLTNKLNWLTSFPLAPLKDQPPYNLFSPYQTDNTVALRREAAARHPSPNTAAAAATASSRLLATLYNRKRYKREEEKILITAATRLAGLVLRQIDRSSESERERARSKKLLVKPVQQALLRHSSVSNTKKKKKAAETTSV
ncbi:uncharacterized protein LOC120354551 [Nilaparvata lugens]|uniref:uncharacterized protein LOC120354551 n=1 Tax=Nilaparvata lugens TaxID=108931 RepID=UPI00193D5534|nr:uncharacterized protein LOC120354551 [Nilaparvata lugens]